VNAKQIGLGLVLADFATLTAWAAYKVPNPLDWLAAIGASPITILIAVDLVIALALVVAVMWKDARARGINPVPFAALTLLTGSIGPLAYLIRRESVMASSPGPRAVARAV